ncbi:recombinase family protein [Cryobacterium sp. M91]|uniref:recombinase family protein n=1 Tax=Cryobacterium sp. M91 TaxID=2048294 RepID=UPI001E425A7E|nr:recombinase family protein [Cryobacterium sp. M91]
MLIGYARVSTNDQDLTAQRNARAAHGVTPEKTFTVQGLTGANRARPGLREALAACRDGDTLVVTKQDRLARTLRDAKDVVDELTRREVKLSIGGSIHDPTDTVGRLLFNVLAMVAELEADLIRAQTREGMAVAKAKGRLRGKRSKLFKAQEKPEFAEGSAPRSPGHPHHCADLGADPRDQSDAHCTVPRIGQPDQGGRV